MFSSLAQPTPPKFWSSRPVRMFLSALLVLVAALAVRGVREWLRPPNPTPVTLESSAYADVERWRAAVSARPDDAHAQAQLGLSLLRRVRETGDPALYTAAAHALDAAIASEPELLDALVGQGVLSLALHDFAGALAWAEQARAINPFRAEIVGIKVDALVELGRYEEAVAQAQAMVDLRPDLQSYSRVSYVRELHGDVEGAITAMQAAVDSGVPGVEATLWAQVQLGNLYFNRGDLKNAERIYNEALRHRPGYAHALGGLARVDAARGRYRRAIDMYSALVERLPLPEFVIPLGDLYARTGQDARAESQYELATVLQQMSAAAEMDVELELALFSADHAEDPAAAVTMARSVYQRRPTIYAADVLAWSLYRAGEHAEAWQYSQEALRLGTQDALLYYHAGMIARALGENESAQELLEQALAINPHFSVIHAPIAKYSIP